MSRRSTMTLATAGICLLLTGSALAQQPKTAPPEAAARPASPSDPEQTPARAAEPSPPPETEPPGPADPLGTYQRHLQVMVGVRTSYVGDNDYRLFSRTVTRIGEAYPVVQLSLGGGVTLWSEQELSLLVLGLWDYGGSSAELRGEKTDVDIHRLAVGAEVRHHFFPRLYAMGRLAPAAVNTRASLQDSASSTTLYSRRWSFGFDASLGAGFELYGKPAAASRMPRFWLLAEAGYGYMTPCDLRFSPDDEDDGAPQRIGETSLGELAIRGPMFRISGAITFF
ncbi:MAG: hypothetical protein JW751_26815 [Polyangiaceae bacterium]|nr:hypothetical protein [Polyangiaceae bacterium]